MEIWENINNYEEIYQLSNFWRVKSLKFWKEKILKPWKNKDWYSYITLCKNWIYKIFYIHRWVWIYFLWLDINNPEICVLHKKEDLDENGFLNNHVNNLFLGTKKDNAMDCVKKWRHSNQWKLWKYNPKSKKINQYTKDWILIKIWDSMMDIERDLKIRHWNIYSCCLWKRNHAWWFLWRYV